MLRDKGESPRKQVAAGWDAVPRRSARRMRQRNQIETMPGTPDFEAAADDRVEFRDRNKLRDRKFADRDDQIRLQDFDLCIQPRRAIANFLKRRDAIAASGRLAGKTAADRGKINSRSNFVFGCSDRFLKPLKKSATSSPGERFLQYGFAHARSLSYQHYFTGNRAARNRRRMHKRTTTAPKEIVYVRVEAILFLRRSDHCA